MDVDLEATARQTGALRRRRQVKSAQDLLRLILMYCVCDWSLRITAAWFEVAKLGSLSDVAVLKRLKGSRTWLTQIIGECLRQRIPGLPHPTGVSLRLRDASTISRPGSRGTDWRLHLSWDLTHLTLAEVELTDAHGGESFARFAPSANTIEAADRGYAYARSLGAQLAQGGQLVVRTNWQNLPLVAPGHPRWKLGTWIKRVSTPQERAVTLKTPQGVFPLRVIAVPLPRAAAKVNRQRAQQAAQEKKHNIRPETLRAAGFVLLLTNLPASEWSIAALANLYRWRWQVELMIKRLKSLQHLDALRAKDPDLAQTYLLGKVLAALLLEAEQQDVLEADSELLTSETRPASLWRLMQLGWESLRQAVVGPFRFEQVKACLPRLQRYLCEPPRRRKQQLAGARATWVRWFAP